MVYEVLQDFVLALRHLSDGEFFLAVGIASFGAVAVAVTRALHAAQSTARQGRLEHDEAA
jgi:hypothetical protein